MSSMIRTIIRGSILLTEKFAPQIKEQAKLAASLRAGKNNQYHPDGLIYPLQGTEFNTSPHKPLKEYQKKQSRKKINSWLPENIKKAGKFYKRYSDGTIYEIMRTGSLVKCKAGFVL